MLTTAAITQKKMNMPLAVPTATHPLKRCKQLVPGRHDITAGVGHANVCNTAPKHTSPSFSLATTLITITRNHHAQMCHYALYRSPRCRCRWLAITGPCFDGAGFSTCESLRAESSGDGRMHPAVPAYRASPGTCPRHALDGHYDYNQVRMVLRIRDGFHLGAGGDRADPGFDVNWGCRCM